MRKATVKVSDAVKDVLRQSRVEGSELFLPEGQLDRSLYTAVNKVLETLGGKWNRRSKSHVFATSPKEALDNVLGGAELVDKKKTLQQFFTPDAIADELVNHLPLFAGCSVLEPSAGAGALVKAVLRAEPDVWITAIEIDESLKTDIRTLQADFLQCSPPPHYDFVAMNPPFQDGQDVEHVTHAFKFLKDGGTLAAIMSPAFMFRQGAKWDYFRDLFNGFMVYTKELPPGAFEESGTRVATRIVILRKD